MNFLRYYLSASLVRLCDKAELTVDVVVYFHPFIALYVSPWQPFPLRWQIYVYIDVFYNLLLRSVTMAYLYFYAQNLTLSWTKKILKRALLNYNVQGKWLNLLILEFCS